MHRRTKALAIPEAVKKAVAERDSEGGYPCCIWCGKPAPAGYELAYSCAHYIPRSQGGLGIEKNILTLCPECHREYDHSITRTEMREFFRDYLNSKYTDWNEEKLIYKKWR